MLFVKLASRVTSEDAFPACSCFAGAGAGAGVGAGISWGEPRNPMVSNSAAVSS